MSGQAQVDYDALADQARKLAASASPVATSKKKAQPTIDYDALAAQSRQAQETSPAAPDLTTNSIDPSTGTGYGLYDVPGVGKVPFNRIPDALSAGHSLPPATAARYRDDLAATKPSWLQRVTEPSIPTIDPNTTPADSTWDANRDAAWNAGSNALNLAGSVAGNAAKRAVRTLAGAVKFPFQAGGLMVDSFSSDPAVSARTEDAILAMHPGAQIVDRAREFGKDWQTSSALAGENLIGDALGMYLTGKLAEGTMKAPGAVSDVAQSAVRRLAGSGPGVAGNLVRAVTEDNRQIGLHNADRVADAQQKWQEKQTKALADHQAELLRLRQKYAQDVRTASEKARTGTDADRAQHQSKQLAVKQAYDQSVRDARTKFYADSKAAEQANVEAKRKYNQEIGKTAQQNRETTVAERAKADQAGKLQVGGSQLIYGLRQLDKALNDKAGVMFDGVRELVAKSKQPPLPGTELGTAARAALAKVTGSSELPKPFRDILGKYPESDPEFIDDPTKGVNNLGRVGKDSPYYSVLKNQLGLGGKEAPPVTFADLQGYYSETGAELSKGTLPGDVYAATKELHNAVGDMMQKMAKDAGPEANKMFWDSRKFYSGYMDTFHEPTGPSGSGSPVAQALLAKDPLVAVDKFAGDSGDRGVAVLRRYSDSLANLAQDVRQRAQTKVTVPARKSVADLPTPKTKPLPAGSNLPLPPIQEPAPVPRASNLPLPPVLPEPEPVPYRAPKLTPTKTISAEDLQRANAAAIHARGQGLASRIVGWAAIWPAFRMLSELTRTGETSLRPLAAVPVAGAAGMTVEALLAHPEVMDFLTRASKQQLARIPPDLQGQMPQIVAAAKVRGVPISPILAAYAATIQRNQGGKRPAQPPPSSSQPAQMQGAPQ